MLGLLVGLCILLFAIQDRWIGWGGHGRTKPVVIGALATIALFYTSGLRIQPELLNNQPNALPFFAPILMAVCFLVWRTPAWKVLGGTLDAEVNEVPGTLRRHALALCYLIVAYGAGRNLIQAGVALLVFIVCATGLSRVNNMYSDRGKHVNQWVEVTRGAILGLALAIGFII